MIVVITFLIVFLLLRELFRVPEPPLPRRKARTFTRSKGHNQRKRWIR